MIHAASYGVCYCNRLMSSLTIQSFCASNGRHCNAVTFDHERTTSLFPRFVSHAGRAKRNESKQLANLLADNNTRPISWPPLIIDVKEGTDHIWNSSFARSIDVRRP